MDKQLLLHEAMKTELQRLEITRNKLVNELKKLPTGSITKRYGRFYHVYRKNGKQYMLAIKSEQLLNQLRRRKYITKALPQLNLRINNCLRFLEKDVFYDAKKNKFELPDQYQQVDSSDFWLPGDVDPQEWASAEYESNPEPMAKPSETDGGRIVRSKSEAIIGSILENKSLLHRYEQKIVILGEIFYPDFIILLPNRRRLVYYEHFGKMDDPKYVRKTMHKLDMYSRYGFRLGFDFFMTFEMEHLPFSFSGAKAKIAEILAQDRI